MTLKKLDRIVSGMCEEPVCRLPNLIQLSPGVSARLDWNSIRQVFVKKYFKLLGENAEPRDLEFEDAMQLRNDPVYFQLNGLDVVLLADRIHSTIALMLSDEFAEIDPSE